MLLRRFADEEDQLSVVQREPPHSSHLSMVRKACNEVGFYELPAADIAESHQAGHDPEQVEKTLSEIEGSPPRCLTGSFGMAFRFRSSIATGSPCWWRCRPVAVGAFGKT